VAGRRGPARADGEVFPRPGCNSLVTPPAFSLAGSRRTASSRSGGRRETGRVGHL
jgi:hypothetical protein